MQHVALRKAERLLLRILCGVGACFLNLTLVRTAMTKSLVLLFIGLYGNHFSFNQQNLLRLLNMGITIKGKSKGAVLFFTERQRICSIFLDENK